MQSLQTTLDSQLHAVNKAMDSFKTTLTDLCSRFDKSEDKIASLSSHNNQHHGGRNELLQIVEGVEKRMNAKLQEMEERTASNQEETDGRDTLMLQHNQDINSLFQTQE
jgi:hypothetical protein